MTESPTISTTFRVGKKFRCTITVPVSRTSAVLKAEWEPDVPNRRLNKVELSDYRRGRDALISELAQQLGGNIVLAEI
jgi:hypothetical protein